MRDERLKEDISLINEVKITTEANNKARVCRLKFISISLYLVMNLYSSVRKRRRWAKRICRRQNRNGDVRTGITKIYEVEIKKHRRANGNMGTEI